MNRFTATLLILAALNTTFFTIAAAEESKSFTVVVMDPMAAPLACDCVQGYAQRKYEKLGGYLQTKLNRPVKVYWGDSLPATMAEHRIQADLVIGKHSVVESDANEAKQKLHPIAQLSSPDGSVTQTGLFVVRKDDSAKSVKDLAGYRVLFGPKDCDEKHAAPIALLKKNGVALPSPLEVSPACSTAASELMELDADVKAAAVISSYAAPLLEGCGTIQKGDLRVIGTSKPVPFITAFINSELSERLQSDVKTALLDVELNAELMVALETGVGFTEWKARAASNDEANVSDAAEPPTTTRRSKKKS